MHQVSEPCCVLRPACVSSSQVLIGMRHSMQLTPCAHALQRTVCMVRVTCWRTAGGFIALSASSDAIPSCPAQYQQVPIQKCRDCVISVQHVYVCPAPACAVPLCLPAPAACAVLRQAAIRASALINWDYKVGLGITFKPGDKPNCWDDMMLGKVKHPTAISLVRVRRWSRTLTCAWGMFAMFA